MNDFFTPDGVTDDGLSAKEEKELRAKIQADVFEGKPAEFDDDEVVVESDAKTIPKVGDEVIVEDNSKVDPDTTSEEDVLTTDPDSDPKPAALSPEMQAIVDSVNKLTSSLTGMEDRIKQTERRVGGISNEFYAAKEAAATQAKAPTPEEMADAAKNEAAWEDLKKDFPSWADAINSKLKTQTANFVSVDAFEELRKSVSQMSSVDAAQIDPGQLETRLVGLIHPDYKQITADPAYATWLNAQSDEIKFKAYKGTTAEEAIDVFNQFKAHNVASKPAASSDSTQPTEVEIIKEKQKKRLAGSTVTNTKHKTIKQKAESDMTPDELREHIANKVFAKEK